MMPLRTVNFQEAHYLEVKRIVLNALKQMERFYGKVENDTLKEEYAKRIDLLQGCLMDLEK